jgi:hypothetical protein
MWKTRRAPFTGVTPVNDSSQTSNKLQIARLKTKEAVIEAGNKMMAPFNTHAKSFKLFSQFPIEIQRKIWESCIEPRVHELHPSSNLYQNRMSFKSNSAATPAIFHVCRESRAVALSLHQLMEYKPREVSFRVHTGIDNDDDNGFGKGIQRFYFAPKYDTLFFNSLIGLFVLVLLSDGDEHQPLAGRLLRNNPSARVHLRGLFRGWERVAMDANRARHLGLRGGVEGSKSPQFKHLIPDLKELVLAFDHDSKGRTHFRDSVFPGTNGTSLIFLPEPKEYSEGWKTLLDEYIYPLKKSMKECFAKQEIVRKIKTDTVPDGVAPLQEAQEALVGDEIVIDERTYLENRARAASPHVHADKEISPTEITYIVDGIIPDVTIAKVHRKRYLRGDLRYVFRWSCAIVHIRPRGIFRRL